MQNIEIKARCPDLDAARRRLAECGLEPVEHLRQTDTYFTVPRGRLKLREEEGLPAKLIQYHRQDALTAHPSDYIIALVPEPAVLKEALSLALGVRVVVRKRRDLYLWGRTRVHLDDVEGLGSFLELETVLTDQTPEEAKQECREVQAALGIREEDLLAGSYADLLA